MKKYLPLAVVVAVIVLILLLFQVFRQAAIPESAIIGRERDKFSASLDKERQKKDPVYASEFQKKVNALDYGIALAYNKENKPDEAIAILKNLISAEESKSERHSRSLLDEAHYYDALQASYFLKKDTAGAEKALQRSKQLMAKAEAAKRKETEEEGRSVGILDE